MSVSRRAVLSASAATAAAAALGPSPAAAAPPKPNVDRAAWRELRQSLTGVEGCAPVDNQRYAGIKPAGKLVCRNEQDVQKAVRRGVETGRHFVARSGGHNYAGYSTTDGLMICLRSMNEVRAQGRRLHLGGGATNSDVYAARGAGLYFPGGRCPGVGVAGLTLGGGLGFNDRKWGLTCDRLVETRVVLADGSVVRASANENADLFWACRGGAGGNFGINTAFVFDAVPVQRLRATVFSLTFDLKYAVQAVEEAQRLLKTDRTNDFDVRIGFANAGDGKPVLQVLGQRLGPQGTVRRLFRRLLTLHPNPAVIKEHRFWAAQDFLLAKPATRRDCYATKSLVPYRWLDANAIAAIRDWTRGWRPGPSKASGGVTLFAMGGASAKPRPDETAYPHRAGTFVIDINTRWKPGTEPSEVTPLIEQTRELHATLSGLLKTDAAYVNFPDPDLENWQHAYYGANYQRLREIKRRYDPTNQFRYPQSIEPAEDRATSLPASHPTSAVR